MDASGEGKVPRKRQSASPSKYAQRGHHLSEGRENNVPRLVDREVHSVHQSPAVRRPEAQQSVDRIDA